MDCGLFEMVSRHSRDEIYRKLVRIVCSSVDTGIRGLRKEDYADLLLRQSVYLTAVEKVTVHSSRCAAMDHLLRKEE
jgi:hypothetical protein